MKQMKFIRQSVFVLVSCNVTASVSAATMVRSLGGGTNDFTATFANALKSAEAQEFYML
jgi:hypothetical protein